eukprot:6863899-Pyramimonas_sp.AAC.1
MDGQRLEMSRGDSTKSMWGDRPELNRPRGPCLFFSFNPGSKSRHALLIRGGQGRIRKRSRDR